MHAGHRSTLVVIHPGPSLRIDRRNTTSQRGHDMSTDDNVKTIQSVYEAFGRGDLPAPATH